MATIKPSDRLLRYPPMERQDLNQSQLGSFKFMPVDNIQSIDAIATNYLKQQLTESLLRAEAIRPTTAIAAPRENAVSIQATSSQVDLARDMNFFNKHIKPDLAESRLRLGPAALRSAVEGAAKSPTKQECCTNEQQHEAQAQAVSQAEYFWNSQDTGHSSFEVPNMDPTAAAFVPTATLNQSLGLALVNEQQAHSATRAALRKEVERSTQLEEQIKKHQQQISRLTITVNNLGAIIKHNINGGPGVDPVNDRVADPVKDTEESALHDFYRSNPRLAKTRDPSILVGESKHHGKREPLASLGAGAAAASVNGVKADETMLYNFELLTSPHDDGSPISALRQTLRKQFSIAEDLRAHQTIPATPVKSRTTVHKLIDITPESGDSGEEVMEEKEVQSSSSPTDGDAMRTRVPSHTNVPSESRLLTTKTPVLQLVEPTAFLNKYGRTPSGKEYRALEDLSTQSNEKMSLPQLQDLHTSARGEVPSAAVTVADDNKNESLDQTASSDSNHSNNGNSGTTITALDGTRDSHTPDRITVQLPSDFDGHPKWLLNKENPVFNSEEEMYEAVRDSGIPWLKNSPFTSHPVRYLPEDAASNRNAYRTVMIDDIPVGTSTKDVLGQVRGGALESIQLISPIGRVTPFMTARVVFLHEAAADEMRNRHQKAPCHINGAQVRVWKPIDPTYPLNAEIEDAIWGEDEASRILLIGNVNDCLFGLLPVKLASQNLHRSVIEYSWTWDGYASIEFTDVKSAFKAARELRKDGDFYGADFRYDRDYTGSKYTSKGAGEI